LLTLPYNYSTVQLYHDIYGGIRMATVSEFSKTADWKNEKHVPVIETPTSLKKGEMNSITVTVGKEIAHPNTTEHFIGWIALFFKPENDNNLYSLGKATFDAHGASAEGANTLAVLTEPSVVFNVKLDMSGTLIAQSWCTIHGIWEYSLDITL